MAEAARLHDPIEHSSKMGGLLTGMLVGAAVAGGVLLTVSTGGLAGAAIVGGLVSAGGLTGEVLGGMNMFTSPSGKVISGSPVVSIDGLPAARAHVDQVVCEKDSHHTQVIAMGSDKVFIDGYPAARKGDKTACDGVISSGSSTVNIGGGTEQTDPISSEVPAWLHNSLVGIGIISTGYFLFAAPALTVLGVAGGMGGEHVGHALGGSWYGEGSDAQTMMTLGGAFIGGGAAVRGGRAFNSRYQVSSRGLGANGGNLRITRRPPAADSAKRANEFTSTLRGEPVTLKNVSMRPLTYTKRPPEVTAKLRSEFNQVRKSFLKDMASTEEKRSILRGRGFTDTEIARMQDKGAIPKSGWQVHHNKPLDDGGDNAFDNLTLIKNDPYHQAITNYQMKMARGMQPGDTQVLDWPFIDSPLYP